MTSGAPGASLSPEGRDLDVPREIPIDPGRLLRRAVVALIGVEVLLVYLDVVVTFFEAVEHEAIQDLCSLVLETGIGNWVASSQSLLVAVTLALIAVRVGAEPASRKRSRGWAVLALLFLYLSLDDGAFLHESVATWVEDLLGAGGGDADASSRSIAGWLLGSFPSYAWQVLFLPFLIGMAAFLWRFSRRELRPGAGPRLLLAGLGCFAAAIALDFIEGMEWPYLWLSVQYFLYEDTVPHFSGVIEEFLEMLGTTLMLRAYLGHLLVSLPAAGWIVGREPR